MSESLLGTQPDPFSQPLYPRVEDPVCATAPKYCLPQNVQLRLREKAWSVSGYDFKITDATDPTQVHFQCDGKAFSLKAKKVLRDHEGHAILNMKDKLFTLTDKFELYAGEKSDMKICQFNAKVTFLKSKLSVSFNDIHNGCERLVVMKGTTLDRKCGVYLGEPKQGGELIARMYRPGVTARYLLFGVDDYILEIAAGVDCALLVMMCVALDEHTRFFK